MGAGFKTFTAGSILTASDVQNYLQDQSVMVFGGTAARSSAIGTANFEEGMLTYLTDVDKLQVYTGASFVDVYPPAATAQGLTLINTTSFSAGVANQSVNNVFTSAYSNYKIVADGVLSLNNDINFRLRAAGTDDSANNYRYGRWYMGQQSSIAFATAQNITSSFVPLATFTTTNTSFIIEIQNPQKTLPTSMLSFGMGLYALHTSSTNISTTSFDGFNILAPSGTFSSGTIRTYGYND
jgi:hypothetical protein